MKNAFKEKPIFTGGSGPEHYDAVPLISKRKFMDNPAITLHTKNNLPANGGMKE